MQHTRTYRTIFKERLTILMVLLFCVLVSSSEYIIQGSSKADQSEQQHTSDDSTEENATFINTAVDAVVPFVVVIMDQVFHLIHEVIGLDRQPASNYKGFTTYSNQFFEVLFEHILATNAP